MASALIGKKEGQRSPVVPGKGTAGKEEGFRYELLFLKRGENMLAVILTWVKVI